MRFTLFPPALWCIAGPTGILMAACRTPEPPTSFSTRDSAGVLMVESHAPVNQARFWRVDAEPSVHIGGSGDGQELFGVWGTVRLTDGRIVVINGTVPELRYYNPSGEYLTTAGRDGGGPGEFRALRWIKRTTGDSILTYDFRLQRVSVFDDAGGFVRSFRLETTDQVPFATILDQFTDGSFLAQGFAATGAETPDGLQRYNVPLYQFDAAGEFLRGLGTSPGAEAFYRAFEGGGFRAYEARFGRSVTPLAHGPNLLMADNDVYQYRVRPPDTTWNRVVRRAHQPVAVTSAIDRSDRDSRLDAAAPESREDLASALRSMPIPETLPAYRRVLVDDLLNVWIENYPVPPDPTATWSVFDAEGVWQGDVELRSGFHPQHIGPEFVLGVWKDDLDLEHVLVFNLRKPNPI